MSRGPTVADHRPQRALHHASVVTPEAVLLEFRAAGVGSRILAKFVDIVLQSLVLSVASTPVALIAVVSEVAAVVFGTILGFVVLFGYPAIEGFRAGQTPGKKMLGIRVVTTEGGPVQFRHAAVRTLVGFAEFLLIPGGLIATVAALVSKRSQRIGDMAAGTIVVRLEDSLSQPIFFPPVRSAEEYSRQFDAGGITKDQFALLRDFMLRHGELSPVAARSLAARLSAGLQRADAPPKPPAMPDEQYLQAAVFAYQQRFSFADGQAQAPMLPFVSTRYGAGYTTAAPPPPGAHQVPLPGSHFRPPSGPPAPRPSLPARPTGPSPW